LTLEARIWAIFSSTPEDELEDAIRSPKGSTVHHEIQDRTAAAMWKDEREAKKPFLAHIQAANDNDSRDWRLRYLIETPELNELLMLWVACKRDWVLTRLSYIK
jgi:hypothetical protein